MSVIPLEQWPDRLSAAVIRAAAGGGPFRRAVVLREVDSTQDAALRLNAAPGDVIAAWEQTRGRGRLGRAWSSGARGAAPAQASDGDAPPGVAVTFVLAPERSERLALLAGIAAAEAVEAHLGRPVGVKWPNDVIVDGRKIAGVLVEQDRVLARVGIGINVRQRDWPADLRAIAISLSQAGACVDRLVVMETLISALWRCWMATNDVLKEAFRRRDLLTGARAVLRHDGREYEGLIIGIDPMTGLTIETAKGRQVLPAATTSVVQVQADGFTRA